LWFFISGSVTDWPLDVVALSRKQPEADSLAIKELLVFVSKLIGKWSTLGRVRAGRRRGILV
jgi:hypothetical protein